VILKYLTVLLKDHLFSTLEEALVTLETGIRQLLLGVAVFLSGIALILFGALMMMVGFFLYLGQKPQFLFPAVCTGFMSVLAGLPLLKIGSYMSRLTPVPKMKSVLT